MNNLPYHKLELCPFVVDTMEKAVFLYETIKVKPAFERVRMVIEEYPEVLNYTHRQIAELVGLERETVSRIMPKLITHK